MGSWNGTCAVSNLHIEAGQDVAVFMLLKNRGVPNNMCYIDCLYSLCHIPFYGKNDSYGSVEDCHGIGFDLVKSAIRDELFEMEIGKNQYHDIAVTKAAFDTELMFEADHENRLGIKTDEKYFEYHIAMIAHYKEKEAKGELKEDDKVYQSRSQATLDQGLNKFQRVTHIQVHGKVFADILQNFAMEYTDEDDGYKVKKCYFKDVVTDIPSFVKGMRQSIEKYNVLMYTLPVFKGNHVSKMLKYYPISNELPLIHPIEMFLKYIAQGASDETLIEFVKAFIEGLWFKSFMSASRKILIPQCGAGSQRADHQSYKVLTDSIRNILKAEKIERREMQKMYG